jgi:hypothetical protein
MSLIDLLAGPSHGDVVGLLSYYFGHPKRGHYLIHTSYPLVDMTSAQVNISPHLCIKIRNINLFETFCYPLYYFRHEKDAYENATQVTDHVIVVVICKCRRELNCECRDAKYSSSN